jgi:hypothetical protein
LLLDHLAILKAIVLGNVGLQRRRHPLGLRVLTNQCRCLWILHKIHVSHDMGLVILIKERFEWFLTQYCHVFRNRILWFLVILQGN